MKQVTATLLFIITLISAFNTVAVAQSDATTTASANVVNSLTTTTVTNISFGNLLKGTDKFLKAEDQSVETINGVISGESFGVVNIASNSGVELTITINRPDDLKPESPIAGFDNPKIPYRWHPQESNLNNVISGIIVNGDENYQGSVRDNPLTALPDFDIGTWDMIGKTRRYQKMTMPDSGMLSVVIGGVVNAGTSLPFARYTGTLTLEVTITN